MKTTIKIIFTIALVLLSASNYLFAAEYVFNPSATYPQFYMFYNGTDQANELRIWGSAIQDAVGQTALYVNEVDFAFELIEKWYATLVIAKVTDRSVRVLFVPRGNGTGKITGIILR